MICKNKATTFGNQYFGQRKLNTQNGNEQENTNKTNNFWQLQEREKKKQNKRETNSVRKENTQQKWRFGYKILKFRYYKQNKTTDSVV